MSAAVLREAARLMRERAEAADKGIGADRWYSNLGGYVELDDFLEGEHYNMVADTGDRAFSDHIASWHPVVALAVAHWLEHAASNAATVHVSTAKVEYGPNYPMSTTPSSLTYSDFATEVIECDQNALAVARAYLGESA